MHNYCTAGVAETKPFSTAYQLRTLKSERSEKVEGVCIIRAVITLHALYKPHKKPLIPPRIISLTAPIVYPSHLFSPFSRFLLTLLQLNLRNALTLQILPSTKRHQRSHKEERIQRSTRIRSGLARVRRARCSRRRRLRLGVAGAAHDLTDEEGLEDFPGFIGMANILQRRVLAQARRKRQWWGDGTSKESVASIPPTSRSTSSPPGCSSTKLAMS